MRLKLILTVCLTMILAQANAYKEQSIDIKVDNQSRNILLYTPNLMTRNMPLLIVTHGMNQDPIYQRDNDRWYELVDTARFVLCYLRSDGNSWDIGGQKDLNFVKQTITQMNKVYGIDKNRVYWSGFSMGSMLIYHGLENGMADYIAAFAPCSGVTYSQPWNNCKRAVNLIHCHSKNDGTFPIDRFQPRDYAAHFATDVDKCSEYKKSTNVGLPGGWDNGDKERWWNGINDTEVEIFMCNGGGHWPTANYIREIWAFCKRFTLKKNKLDNASYTFKQNVAEVTKLVDEWKTDSIHYSGIRSSYKNMKAALTTYNLDNVDQTDITALDAANKKYATVLKAFYTAVANSQKTSKRVTKTEFDPNFHIYLCFGQSNMEGNATPMMEDYSGTTDRFLMLSPVAMSTYGRTKNYWYMARPPLCRDYTGLTPADWFGKTLVKNLPDSITVGVINVALGGCAIEMFNEDGIANYIKQQADWLQGYAKMYNNNPFRYLVDAAKKAQQVGVIKGILLHQGCSNNGQTDWPNKVKLVYDRLLKELNLSEEDCPLLVGELLAQAQGGVCFGHNSVIAKMPQVVSNSHVVSSTGCTGAPDGLHFTAAGYRKIGANYANTMLPLLERYIPNYGYSIKSMKAKQQTISMPMNGSTSITITLTDQASKTHDVTASCKFTCDKPGLQFGATAVKSGAEEGDYTVTATYTNESGEEISTQFTVYVRMFPLSEAVFNPSILKSGSFSVTATSNTFKSTAKGGMGGWMYDVPVDISNMDSLIVELRTTSLAKPEVRIYDTNDANSTSYYSVSMTGLKRVSIDLHNMADTEGKKIDPSHIYIVGLAVQSTSSVAISNVYTCKTNGETAIHMPTGKAAQQSDDVYDLNGRRVTNFLKKGVYVRNGKKFVVK